MHGVFVISPIAHRLWSRRVTRCHSTDQSFSAARETLLLRYRRRSWYVCPHKEEEGDYLGGLKEEVVEKREGRESEMDSDDDGIVQATNKTQELHDKRPQKVGDPRPFIGTAGVPSHLFFSRSNLLFFWEAASGRSVRGTP